MKAPKCICGTRMLRILYGFPSSPMFRKADQGKIYLGGCVIEPNAPKFRCPNCNKTERGNHGSN